MENNSAIAYVLSRTAHIARLTNAEEQAIARQIVKGDTKAVTRIVEANTRLVAHLARMLVPSSGFEDDLFAAGLVGLTEAAKTFKPGGATFGGWASIRIRQEIFATLRALGRPVETPVRFVRMQRDLEAARDRLRPFTQSPSMEELAEESGYQVEMVRAIVYAGMMPVCLDELVRFDDGDDGESRSNLVASDEAGPADICAGNDAIEFVRRTIKESDLNAREREVLARRYGLDGRREETLEDIGRRFGVTRERARQIEQMAERKLRTALSVSPEVCLAA